MGTCKIIFSPGVFKKGQNRKKIDEGKLSSAHRKR